MSKKLNISIPNKVRPNLSKLFHEYIVRKGNERSSSSDVEWDVEDYADMIEYWDRVFPGWDDNLDDGDVIFPIAREAKAFKEKQKAKEKRNRDVYTDYWEEEDKKSKKGKKKHSRGKGKAKLVDIHRPYDGEEEGYNFDGIDLVDYTNVEDDYSDEQKSIWFYLDYHCKEDKLEFNSLKEFSDYCKSMGYFIPQEVLSDISWRYESHCCLCPLSEKVGLLEIMSENSYGNMFYEACEEDELG